MSDEKLIDVAKAFLGGDWEFRGIRSPRKD